ncbi:MAG TPA: DegT/DnrJ/EryC1/StrS family aminotransferase [Longilinea sp.]|nr:DegT/DnrJ/EryC1/StrS family aminotransferase [Longilinea sp.]
MALAARWNTIANLENNIMDKVRSIDLAVQYKNLKIEVDEAIERVLSSGYFIMGKEGDAFEREFAAFCGSSHAVGVASGTDAIYLALWAANIGNGDEVITSAHTSGATITAILQAGAVPVLVDIDPQTYTLDPKLVNDALTRKTRAIIPVHLYGLPADMAPLLDIASKHTIVIIEDCAQAHGAEYKGKKVGSLGEAGAFSFYPTKNLGACGDAGMVVTNNPELAQKAHSLRQYGWNVRNISDEIGFNSRMDELQAAVLRVKLPYLDRWNTRRIALARLYSQLLAGLNIQLPVTPSDRTHVFHQYVIRSAERDSLRQFLTNNGIETLVHYPLPIHMQPAYSELGHGEGSFPEAERACRELISLPLYPEMSESMVERVAAVIKSWKP